MEQYWWVFVLVAVAYLLVARGLAKGFVSTLSLGFIEGGKFQSKYYPSRVFDSPDLPGSGMRMAADTLRKLDRATEIYGLEFTITSGYRTPAHNIKVGGVAGSSHTLGRAVDIDTQGWNQAQVISALVDAGFRRIGIYSGHVHADDDPNKPSATWYG